MKLSIKFPKNLVTERLIQQKHIPCHCRIVPKLFALTFNYPFGIEIDGTVEDWKLDDIEERALAGGGGEYLFFAPALVSLKKEDDTSYTIIDLSIFDEGFGWCPILKNGILTEPVDFSDPIDEAEFFSAR